MGKIKVLVVDDEPDFLEVIGRRLDGWGYEVVKAPDGLAAISAVKREKPDVIVLDYIMRSMDGIATLKEIRKIDSGTPVIMFTAYPEIKAMKEAEKLGINAFIPKMSMYGEATISLKSAIEMAIKKLNKGKQP